MYANGTAVPIQYRSQRKYISANCNCGPKVAAITSSGGMSANCTDNPKMTGRDMSVNCTDDVRPILYQINPVKFANVCAVMMTTP